MATKHGEETMSDTIRDEFSSLNNGVNKVRSEAAHIASALGEDFKTQASKLTAATQKQARRALTAANEQVRQHPTTTLGIAAAVGVLLGMMIARRR